MPSAREKRLSRKEKAQKKEALLSFIRKISSAPYPSASVFNKLKSEDPASVMREGESIGKAGELKLKKMLDPKSVVRESEQ